ncbi:hypothetical protein A3B21_00030 [Candidatus Uhrbacteria bacterium RIFCSPLOWO2_01_FULL_47_24]|uniref:DNA helicase UvrD n=1 Tax=Candidatus Uhrbacteria bacterium RIFCSPLOWO2_01_FULL_47_24 TaxID=1802401 RepID=A0A1F7UTV7_9BACT|nr:MAG: hypothetical protein A2753_00320 [Candidatus Uhrbacteria bacterium RIFCSPHIGHO2_01_FULL_47_11]OGL69254.1 MAG: hypothetical protein A3D58_03085 [Candidatus Uhrbacteria bacterium RIFCSPHIGHO2_02_FULL_46_47]OGL76474.1 MAG: hypothetical protein A3F52_01510 [Candidatus Uhrbacteria bacterium RIFCSPHIGHO2_12_FULL_47_11]OGL81750.1 MAG: hypothetical protein A3B21_00030 [Candidatus Uhrbacteria bacterium RIFCSPLOWO2_01_FULL_47_24]OGL85383.1 MAG: hypothetical protein A3J03_04860 [Candidatus Uhrbact
MSRFIADLHTHSKYARACSPQLTLENMDAWARVKGVDILSTGDFTHPKWFEEIKAKLVPAREIFGSRASVNTEARLPAMYDGLYVLRPGLTPTVPPQISLPQKPTLFMLGTELACIYSQGAKKMRRVHHLIYAPTIEVAAQINAALTARGCKLGSDGRAIIGMNSKELLKIILEIDPRNVLIPAHAWTPWFAIFGSNSGFNSIAECFEELTPHIFAIETGLSSDPLMNWRVKELDQVALVSSADAHSLPNLGREATVFEGNMGDLSYDSIMQAIREAAPARLANSKLLIANSRFKMLGTIEFIPDEGRYHYDGHRACKVCLHPRETKKLGGICPKCKKAMTIGVLSRVEELANQPEGRRPEYCPQFWSLVELDKIIAEANGVKGRSSKSVEKVYWDLVAKAGTEANILLNMSYDELAAISPHQRFVEAIRRVREGRVKINPPGYDGEYGVVNIFNAEEKLEAKKQSRLL